MVSERTALLVAALLVAVASAGCFGPSEDPVTTEAETGTTPGDTVKAGGQPNAQPDQTPTMLGTTTEGAVNGTERPQETREARGTAEADEGNA